MIQVKLISKKDQGHYLAGQVIRTIEVEQGFDLRKITSYYELEVEPKII